MKETTVIIVYELYKREYDNALLLKAELEKRGYQVEIIFKMDLIGRKFDNKRNIVLIPNAYSTPDFDYYYYALSDKNNVFIDMQYEQILSPRKIDFHTPKGKAASIIHLCWGDKRRSFLENAGISGELLKTVGAIQLDFLTPEFTKLWKSRKQISQEFHIAENKQWILYISTFAVAENEFIATMQKKHQGKKYNASFREFSEQSRALTLDWLEKCLENHPDKILIYRKHPIERYNGRLKQMCEKYPGRFYLIDAYNIKQWIKVCDKIYTWISTSIGECYVADVAVEVIRPLPFPRNYDAVDLYEDKTYINSEEQMLASFEKREVSKENTVSVERIKANYSIENVPSFKRVADIIDEVKNNFCTDGYYDKKYWSNRFRYVTRNHLKLKYYVKRIYQSLYRKGLFEIKNRKFRDRFAVDDWEIRAFPVDESAKYESIKSVVAKTGSNNEK